MRLSVFVHPHFHSVSALNNQGVCLVRDGLLEQGISFFQLAWNARTGRDIDWPTLSSAQGNTSFPITGLSIPSTEGSSSPDNHDLYLVEHAISLVPSSDVSQTPQDPSSTYSILSATISFNLGLAHQLRNPGEASVARYYHISTAALYDTPDSHDTFLLAVAALNNFAAWCYANGNVVGTQSCLQKLSTLLHDEEYTYDLNTHDGDHHEPRSLQQGVMSNIRFLGSKHAASPSESTASPAA